MALQIAQLSLPDMIDQIARNAGFRTTEAFEICRIGLQNYVAGALILPYRVFMEAARALRHDLDLLAMRFGASLEQSVIACRRCKRPGAKGVPIFFRAASTAPATSPSAIPPPSCNSPVSAPPVRYGMRIRPSSSRAASSGSWRRRPDGVRYLCFRNP